MASERGCEDPPERTGSNQLRRVQQIQTHKDGCGHGVGEGVMGAGLVQE